MTAKPIWTIAKVLDWTKQYFAEKGLENPRLDAEILLCSVLKCQRITLYVHFDQPLEEHELAQYRGYVARRAAAEPLAYILGSRAFMKYDFKVTPDVLVPRPETELLVECTAKLAGFIEKPQILDIGTAAVLLSYRFWICFRRRTARPLTYRRGRLPLPKKTRQTLALRSGCSLYAAIYILRCRVMPYLM